MPTAACISDSIALASVGFCRYVGEAYKMYISPLTHSAASQLQTRADSRERYDIRGSMVDDCFASWCCRPCALSQERREIELEENSFHQRDEK